MPPGCGVRPLPPAPYTEFLVPLLRPESPHSAGPCPYQTFTHLRQSLVPPLRLRRFAHDGAAQGIRRAPAKSSLPKRACGSRSLATLVARSVQTPGPDLGLCVKSSARETPCKVQRCRGAFPQCDWDNLSRLMTGPTPRHIRSKAVRNPHPYPE